MEILSNSLSRGIGGSHTKWQRKPPAHKVYDVDTPEGKTVVTVYAENRAIEDADHPNVQKIEEASDFAKEIAWSELSDDVQTAVQDHFNEEVKDDEWFMDTD